MFFILAFRFVRKIYILKNCNLFHTAVRKQCKDGYTYLKVRS